MMMAGASVVLVGEFMELKHNSSGKAYYVRYMDRNGNEITKEEYESLSQEGTKFTQSNVSKELEIDAAQNAAMPENECSW